MHCCLGCSYRGLLFKGVRTSVNCDTHFRFAEVLLRVVVEEDVVILEVFTLQLIEASSIL